MSEPSVHDLVDPDLTGVLPVSDDGGWPGTVEVRGDEWTVVYVPVEVERRDAWTRRGTRRS